MVADTARLLATLSIKPLLRDDDTSEKRLRYKEGSLRLVDRESMSDDKTSVCTRDLCSYSSRSALKCRLVEFADSTNVMYTIFAVLSCRIMVSSRRYLNARLLYARSSHRT
jgi:hypothetical protein